MSLTALIYGNAGVGKTPVALSAPGRVLLIATESGHRFIRDRTRVTWNPCSPAPAELPDDALCIADVQSWEEAESVLQVLLSGNHMFDSVVVDTLSELQSLAINKVAPTGRMDMQKWGSVLNMVGGYFKLLVGLTEHRTNPLKCVVGTAHTTFREGDTECTPDLSGAIRTQLIKYVDVCGYLGITSAREDLEAAPGPADRVMVISPGFGAQARDRTSSLPGGGITGAYGPKIPGPINLSGLINITEE